MPAPTLSGSALLHPDGFTGRAAPLYHLLPDRPASNQLAAFACFRFHSVPHRRRIKKLPRPHAAGERYVESQFCPHHVWSHSGRPFARSDTGLECSVTFARLFAVQPRARRLARHHRKPPPQSPARPLPQALTNVLEPALRFCVLPLCSLLLIPFPVFGRTACRLCA